MFLLLQVYQSCSKIKLLQWQRHNKFDFYISFYQIGHIISQSILIVRYSMLPNRNKNVETWASISTSF